MNETKHLLAHWAHTLDVNGDYHLHFAVDAQRHLSVHIAERDAISPRLLAALESQLAVSVHVPLRDEELHLVPRGDHFVSVEPLPEGVDGLTLAMGHEILAHYQLEPNTSDGMEQAEALDHHREALHVVLREAARALTVAETRRLGTFHGATLYHQPANDPLLQTAKQAVFTDFHSHSSGQISGRGLLNVAMRHEPYYYPTELVALALGAKRFAQLKARKPKRTHAVFSTIPRVPFPPLDNAASSQEVEAVDLHALAPDELAAIAAKMAMPTDRQSTYAEMEMDAYRFRYPLTKDAKLEKEVLKQTVKEYEADGIRYAELSTVGLERPDKFRLMHEAMAEIEAEQQAHQARDAKYHPCRLRFLVGIPRTFAPAKVAAMMEKAKLLSQSPYVVGVDLLGYEANKTKDFLPQFKAFCDWAETHRPGFTIRAHAGENGKNPDNVGEVIALAQAHPALHFRIGHGMFGLDAATLTQAMLLCRDEQNPRLLFEFNPDSVLALNNIDDLRAVPFETLIRHGIPFTVSSDSAGTYGTCREQLGIAAYAAGLDAKGFGLLAQHQQRVMDCQIAYSAARAKHFNAAQQSATEAALAAVQQKEKMVELPTPSKQGQEEAEEARRQQIAHALQEQNVILLKRGERAPELEGRVPVTIVGASGTHGSRIPDAAMQDMRVLMEMLTEILDPEKVYFVQGRTKGTGLSGAVNQAITARNTQLAAACKPTFANVGLLVAAKWEEGQSYRDFTHVSPISYNFLKLADAIVDHTYGKQSGRSGVLVAAGGSAFTRDIILKADLRHDIPRPDKPDRVQTMLLMTNTGGASAEKAAVLSPDYAVANAKALVATIVERHPELLRAPYRACGTDTDALDALCATATEAVAHQPVPTGNQRVDSVSEPLAAPGVDSSRGGANERARTNHPSGA